MPTESLTLADMHAGCVVGFGFMPQKSVSGKRIPVSEINSYLFEDDNFIVHRLSNDSADINLIVADDEDPTGTYLALSQRIEPRLFDSLFPGNLPPSWFGLKEGASLEAKPPVLGASQGWLTARYTLAILMKGRFMEGDYRMRKPADRARLSREFDYVLWVDDNNEYAIEAEKYEDGMINVFATIYRPATDIGEISRAAKAILSSSVETIPHIPPAENAKALNTLSGSSAQPAVMEAVKPVLVENISKLADDEAAKEAKAESGVEQGQSSLDAIAAALVELKAEEEKKEKEEEKASIVSISPVEQVKPAEIVPEEEIAKPEMKTPEAVMKEKPDTLEAVVKPIKPETVAIATAKEVSMEETPAESPLHSKFGRIQPAMQEQTAMRNTLSCDLRLAGRLIAEAQRNQMPLSELVRKVIDLPARLQDKVFIPIDLGDAELAELARRYSLSAADGEAVKQQIIEELQRFVGERK